MKITLIAAAIALISATASVSASPFATIENDPNVLVNNPTIKVLDEMACFGCISPNTGRIRDGYVRPYTKRNGTSVRGYWRS